MRCSGGEARSGPDLYGQRFAGQRLRSSGGKASISHQRQHRFIGKAQPRVGMALTQFFAVVRSEIDHGDGRA